MLNGLLRPAGTTRNGTFITKAGRIPISLLQEEGVVGFGTVQADVPHDVHIHRHTLGDVENPIPGLSRNPMLAKAETAAPIVSIVKGMTFLLVRLESLEMLAQVEIVGSELGFHGLLDKDHGWDEGFVAKYYYVVEDGEHMGDSGQGKNQATKVRTRMVESAMEDPATGSAACALGSYLALREKKTMTFEMTQGVEMGRRSVMGVEVTIDEKKRVGSIRLSGSAVQVMEGALRI